MRLLFTLWWYVINFKKGRISSVLLAFASARDHCVSNQSMPLEGSWVLAHVRTPCSWLQYWACCRKPENQGLLWSTLCFTYPRGSATFAKKPCTTLMLLQPQNIRKCLVLTNFLPRWINQGQGDHVGSFGLLTEPCFFILTFFVFGACLKWRDHKINRRTDLPSPVASLDQKRVITRFPCSSTDVSWSNFPSLV